METLPQPDRLIKICTDAGFVTTVEVGQYFMTKHTDEFSQFTEPVTCREPLLQVGVAVWTFFPLGSHARRSLGQVGAADRFLSAFSEYCT